MSYGFHPIVPVWFIAAVAVALMLLLAQGCRVLARKRVPRRWIGILGVLRTVIVVVVVLCLLQPVVTLPRGSKSPAPLMVLIDTSKSMAGTGQSQGESPLASVTAALNGEFGEDVREKFDPHWFAFDGNARRLEATALSGLTATGEHTRLGRSLEGLFHLRQLAGEAGEMSASSRVLLASDGHDHGDLPAARIARRLGFSVDVLIPGFREEAAGAPGARVVRVHGPERVLLGSELVFQVLVRRTPVEEDASVQLRMMQGEDLVARAAVEFAAGQKEHWVAVRHRPQKPGVQSYAFAVSARSESAEAVSDGGVEEAPAPYGVAVQVERREHEVLLLEDTWRWEVKFLRRVLESDPSFNFTAFLARGPHSRLQFGEPERNVHLGGFPQGANELGWFDIVILGDVDPRRWPSGFASVLRDWVAENGRSLIVIAGPQTSGLSRLAPLRELLPVHLAPAAPPVEGPIALRPTSAGVRAGFFAQAETAPELWNHLPAVDRLYAVQGRKPAATVLARTVPSSDEETPRIAMAEHPMGRGRVLYVATDTLWKWQMLGPSTPREQTPYEVFWQQALRTLTPERSGSGPVDLSVVPSRRSYREGDTVELSAALRTVATGKPPRIEAVVTAPDEREIPLRFRPAPSSPGSFVTEFNAGSTGIHRVEVKVQDEDRTVATARTAVYVRPPPREVADVGINRAALEELARRTGGHVIDPASPSTWSAPKRSALEDSTPRFVTVNLWQNVSLLLLLAGLFGVDWLVRLVRGYA